MAHVGDVWMHALYGLGNDEEAEVTLSTLLSFGCLVPFIIQIMKRDRM